MKTQPQGPKSLFSKPGAPAPAQPTTPVAAAAPVVPPPPAVSAIQPLVPGNHTAPALTRQEFIDALPANFKKSVNQALIDQINQTLSSPEEMETYKENLLNWTTVLKEGKFKMESYLNAVRYVSFKVMNLSNQEAYFRTFPDKHARFKLMQTPTKDITSYVSAYNKSKLVGLVYELSMIPTHILNAPLFQEALNCQADLMINAKSEMVRCNAATSILTHLKPPENKKIELEIGVKQDDTITKLREATQKLTEAQRTLMESGVSAQEIAHSSIVDTTLEVLENN